MSEPQPTYVPADNAGSRTIVILAWVLPALATIAVVLRIASRKMQRLDLRIDDILILVALVPLWGHTAIILVTVYLGGVGHPVATLQPGNSVALFKGLTALQYSFGTTLGLIKTSIVFLLIRIFHTKQFRKLAYCVIAYLTAWAVMCIFIGSFLCVPFAKNWEPTLPGTCGSLFKAHTCIAALDILGNLLIISLPLPWIWRLHQDRTTKIFLSAIFMLGFLDVAVGILRVVYLIQLLSVADIQGNAVNTWIWSVAEPSIAVFVACGPTYKPLLRLFRRGGTSRSKSSYIKQSNKSHTPSQRTPYDEYDSFRLDTVAARNTNKPPIHALGRGNTSFNSDDHPIINQGSLPGRLNDEREPRFADLNSRHGGINMQREIRIDYDDV